ncbi:MAG: hypothetical protein LBJ46_00620 [Planctomycetota bacterium]|jgi:hypothetical protein|nr:hypothetical protein [Planctomycetota bacterium]
MIKYAVTVLALGFLLLFAAGCDDGAQTESGMGSIGSGTAHYGAGGSLPGNCADCSVN